MKYLTLKNPLRAIQYKTDGTSIENILLALGNSKEVKLIELSDDGCVHLAGIPIYDGDWICNDDGFLDIIPDSAIQRHYNVADNWDNGGFW